MFRRPLCTCCFRCPLMGGQTPGFHIHEHCPHCLNGGIDIARCPYDYCQGGCWGRCVPGAPAFSEEFGFVDPWDHPIHQGLGRRQPRPRVQRTPRQGHEQSHRGQNHGQRQDRGERVAVGYGFDRVRALPGPGRQERQEILLQIARMALPIMRRFKISVKLLTDFKPDSETGGRNLGETVQQLSHEPYGFETMRQRDVLRINLRAKNEPHICPSHSQLFCVLLHELAHCRQTTGEPGHGVGFFKKLAENQRAYYRMLSPFKAHMATFLPRKRNVDHLECFQGFHSTPDSMSYTGSMQVFSMLCQIAIELKLDREYAQLAVDGGIGLPTYRPPGRGRGVRADGREKVIGFGRGNIDSSRSRWDRHDDEVGLLGWYLNQRRPQTHSCTEDMLPPLQNITYDTPNANPSDNAEAMPQPGDTEVGDLSAEEEREINIALAEMIEREEMEEAIAASLLGENSDPDTTIDTLNNEELEALIADIDKVYAAKGEEGEEDLAEMIRNIDLACASNISEVPEGEFDDSAMAGSSRVRAQAPPERSERHRPRDPPRTPRSHRHRPEGTKSKKKEGTPLKFKISPWGQFMDRLRETADRTEASQARAKQDKGKGKSSR